MPFQYGFRKWGNSKASLAYCRVAKFMSNWAWITVSLRLSASAKTLESGAMSGQILETWVIAELLKSYLHHGLVPPFYYYRDKDKKEIDLLIVRDGTLFPLECKKTASPNREDIRTFHTLAGRATPTGAGGIICLAKDVLPIADGILSIPVAAL